MDTGLSGGSRGGSLGSVEPPLLTKAYTLLSTYNFKRLLAALTSIEGNIERSVTN